MSEVPAPFTTTLVPATVPNFTAVTPVKLVPLTVTEVPPAVDPEVGLTPVTVGAGGVVKVNWSAGELTAEVPPAAVTVTSTAPADSAGEVTVSEVPAPFTTTLVPATVPNFTAVTPVKLVPVTVTEVPPAVDPEVGLTPGDGGCGRGGEGELVGGRVDRRGAPRRGDGHVDGPGRLRRRGDGERGPAPFTTTLVPATVPNFTAVTPVKLVPLTVTEVPPAVDPEVGLTPVTVGAGGAVKVNWSAGGLVAEVPPAAVTVTSTAPADSAGEVTVSEVPAQFTTTLVPATVPNFTAVTPVKLVPLTVTEVPPAVDPEVGLTPVTVGAGGGAPLLALKQHRHRRGGRGRGLRGGGRHRTRDGGVIGDDVVLAGHVVGEARGAPGHGGVVGHRVAEVELTGSARGEARERQGRGRGAVERAALVQGPHRGRPQPGGELLGAVLAVVARDGAGPM